MGSATVVQNFMSWALSPQSLKITYSGAVQPKHSKLPLIMSSASYLILKWVVCNISKWQFKMLSRFQHQLPLFWKFIITANQINAVQVKTKSNSDQLAYSLFLFYFSVSHKWANVWVLWIAQMMFLFSLLRFWAAYVRIWTIPVSLNTFILWFKVAFWFIYFFRCWKVRVNCNCYALV